MESGSQRLRHAKRHKFINFQRHFRSVYSSLSSQEVLSKNSMKNNSWKRAYKIGETEALSSS